MPAIRAVLSRLVALLAALVLVSVSSGGSVASARETSCVQPEDLKVRGGLEGDLARACRSIGRNTLTEVYFYVDAASPENGQVPFTVPVTAERVAAGAPGVRLGTGNVRLALAPPGPNPDTKVWDAVSGTMTIRADGGSLRVQMESKDEPALVLEGDWKQFDCENVPSYCQRRDEVTYDKDYNEIRYVNVSERLTIDGDRVHLGDEPATLGATPDTDVTEPDTTTTSPPGLCPTKVTRAVFEPTQAVWQDDPYFADRPGKQLRQVSDTEYAAELPMVADRRTLIFGNRDHREFIEITGTTTGTTPGKVSAELRARGAGAHLDEDVKTDPSTLALFEPCDEEHEFTVQIPTAKGIPADRAFAFTGTGDYKLTLQLKAREAVLQSPIFVTGTVVKTRSPLVLFVPVSLHATPAKGAPQRLPAFEEYTKALKDDANEHIPDYVPLKPGGLQGFTQPVQYVGDALREKQSSLSGWASAAKNKLVDWAVKDKYAYQKLQAQDALEFLSAEIVRRLGVQSSLANGERIVAVLVQDQYDLVDPLHGEAGTGSGGIAVTSKVIFVPDVDHPPHTEVAHELIHTLPYLWSSDEMSAECAVDYHDKPAVNAFGFQVMSGATEQRASRDGQQSFMSTNMRSGQWIDQCTYRHLTDALQHTKDPAVVLVQGMLHRDGDRVEAQLWPFYQLDGEVDLDAAAAPTGYAIVLRNAGTDEIARYPFEPHWEGHAHEQDFTRSIVSFVYRVPAAADLATIEVEGPDGVLTSQKLSTRPPTLNVTEPRDNARVARATSAVNVAWKSTAPSASVFTSGDGGRTWQATAIERNIKRLRVALPRADRRLLKVVVTDGTRSAERIVQLQPAAKRANPSRFLAVFVVVIAAAALARRRRRQSSRNTG